MSYKEKLKVNSRRIQENETGCRRKEATVTWWSSHFSLVDCLWDLAQFPKFLWRPSRDDLWRWALIPLLNWFMCSFISSLTQTSSRSQPNTLHAHTLSGSYIHQTFVMGNSFINDRIHFCRSSALWCMGKRAEVLQMNAHTGRLIFDWMCYLLFCKPSWFTLSRGCHNHIQGRLLFPETINLILKCCACYTFTLKEN